MVPAVVIPYEGDRAAGAGCGAAVIGWWWGRRWRWRAVPGVEEGEPADLDPTPSGAVAPAEQASRGCHQGAHSVEPARSGVPAQSLPLGEIERRDLIAEDGLGLELSGVVRPPAAVIPPDGPGPGVVGERPLDPTEVSTGVDGLVGDGDGVHAVERARDPEGLHETTARGRERDERVARRRPVTTGIRKHEERSIGRDVGIVEDDLQVRRVQVGAPTAERSRARGEVDDRRAPADLSCDRRRSVCDDQPLAVGCRHQLADNRTAVAEIPAERDVEPRVEVSGREAELGEIRAG